MIRADHHPWKNGKKSSRVGLIVKYQLEGLAGHALGSKGVQYPPLDLALVQSSFAGWTERVASARRTGVEDELGRAAESENRRQTLPA